MFIKNTNSYEALKTAENIVLNKGPEKFLVFEFCLIIKFAACKEL